MVLPGLSAVGRAGFALQVVREGGAISPETEGGVCEGTLGRSRGYPTLRVRTPTAETDPLHWWLLLV